MMDKVEGISEISEYMDRLSNIIRYPIWDKIRNINVAEHSFRVTVLCMVIADMVKDTCDVDFEILMRKALLHDFGEALMGDITYKVKHKDDKTEEFFEELEGSYCEEMFVYTERYCYRIYAKNCKQEIEGRIVNIADMFDNIIYGVREVRMGNHTMLVLIKRCVDFMVDMVSNTPFEFIGNAAVKMMKESEDYINMTAESRNFMEEKYGIRP